LYQDHQDKLVVIGFPANDFQEQEKGSDEEISEFCRINYGVTFPLASKSVVVKNEEQHPVFKWLTDKSKNGWNDQAPEWNFSKYLVAPDGKLLGYYGTAVSPLDIKIP
jgi:glutathione peroxidase